MEHKLKKELKEAASKAVCTMIDKMFIETDVNDDTITISIAGHDIRGYELSLNQYSTEIDVNGKITVHHHKYIRYPNYFGKANVILLKQLTERHMQEVKDHVKKDPSERAEADSKIQEQLRMLEEAVRTLESTGFSPDAIERFLQTVRDNRDFYDNEHPEPEEDVPPPPRGMTADEVLNEAEGRANALRDAERIVQGQDITQPAPRLEPLDIVDDREELPQGYVPEEIQQEEQVIEIALDLMRSYLRNQPNGFNSVINEDMARDLFELATFEEVPLNIMSREINAHNTVMTREETVEEIPSADHIIDMARAENRRQILVNEMQERRAHVNEIDPHETDTRIDHDDAARRFIEQWYEESIEEIGIISQEDYGRMITNIETTEPPGVYLFAMDRVIGHHNAAVTSGRNGLSVTPYAALDGTPQRINIYDAAARHFAHITGCTNPDTDSIGRYVDDEMRQTLYRSGNRNNIPRIYIDWAIEMWNNLHRDENAETWELEESRQSDIFISANFSDTQIIPEDVYTEMTHRAELFGIDPEIFTLSIQAHNRQALERQAQLNREIDEISDEDLQAAADRYDQLTHSPLERDQVPSTTEERMMRNVRLNPDDPQPTEVFEMRDTTDESGTDEPGTNPHNEDDRTI